MDRYRMVITSTAKQDIIDIGDYISNILLEPDTSRRFVKGLRHSISQLQYFPNKFPIVKDTFLARKCIRCMPYKNYYAFYVVSENSKLVTILRVGYNRRNWKNIL